MKGQDPDGFTDEFYNNFIETQTPLLFKVFHEIKRK